MGPSFETTGEVFSRRVNWVRGLGKCVFYENWLDATEVGEVAICEEKELPSDVVFHDIVETNIKDDLSGDALVFELCTEAKRKEITEVYRRGVWQERPVEDCFRDTGKPPIPVRWVCTNKGDSLHPNMRCRLVAKHGGKNAETSSQRCHHSKW